MSENSNAIEVSKEAEALSSQTVVGVRFRSCGKIYTFKVDDTEVAFGDKVVVESEMGLSLGSVAIPKHTVHKPDAKFKKVLRRANEKDISTYESNRKLEEEAKTFCVQKAHDYKLEMKLVATETTLDNKRLIFYFTADGRIDFRELVRDLAAKFKTRIEMRQIGVRDEVKMLGGLGACGRQACCSLFLTSFAPITIKMAKEQDLSINQSKLSGICGRLMCCLAYEHREREAPGQQLPVSEKAVEAAQAEAPAADVKGSSTGESESLDKPAGAEKARGTVPGQGQAEAGPQDEGTVVPGEQSPDDDSGKSKRTRRRRRRRFRPRKKADGDQKPNTDQQAARTAGGEQKQPAGKNRGKPFSKRRKFRKKKKRDGKE